MARFEEQAGQSGGKVAPPAHSEDQLRVMRCAPHEVPMHPVTVEALKTQPARANEPEGPYHFAPCRKCGGIVPSSWDREKGRPRQHNVRWIVSRAVPLPAGEIVQEGGEIVEETEEPMPQIVEEHEFRPRGRRGA
jgi:hypothetical protein